MTRAQIDGDKTKIRNLQYRSRTRLVRGMYYTGVSIKAGYRRSTAAPVGPLTAVCLDFITENKNGVAYMLFVVADQCYHC